MGLTSPLPIITCCIAESYESKACDGMHALEIIIIKTFLSQEASGTCDQAHALLQVVASVPTP